MSNNSEFKFEFSLEILNHLGRGLYRSFATVIAEAVSNSWDSGAKRVDIFINDDEIIIEDDGLGMNSEDFQNKFLLIGYSKRNEVDRGSKRNVIGRKGIGKLAMLSVSEYITIISKKEGYDCVGGIISNPSLDEGIKNEKKYFLEKLQDTDTIEHVGTKIVFKCLKVRTNKEWTIRKYLATQFNFIFALDNSDEFKIFVNNEEISSNDLNDLNNKTQFIWVLGESSYDEEKIKNKYQNIKKINIIKDVNFDFAGKNIEVNGFIASVEEPKNLILRGSDESFKVGVNLFSNGRLRQSNILEEVKSKQIAEEYLYGEIHVNGFEDDLVDRFTSSREGIIKDDPLYQEFLKQLRNISAKVLKDWTPFRNEIGEEGDVDDIDKPRYIARLDQSKMLRAKDFQSKIDQSDIELSTKNTLKEKLKLISTKNTTIYQDLFILENIFREYIRINKITHDKIDDEFLIKEINKVQKSRLESEERHALGGKISQNRDYLSYLDLVSLGMVIDKYITNFQKNPKYNDYLVSDSKEIYPIRNVVMHTNEVTKEVVEREKIDKIIDYIDRLSEI